ncbi:hypothetical protein Droror1_Dr00010623 [Drosera rotundifolia]
MDKINHPNSKPTHPLSLSPPKLPFSSDLDAAANLDAKAPHPNLCSFPHKAALHLATTSSPRQGGDEVFRRGNNEKEKGEGREATRSAAGKEEETARKRRVRFLMAAATALRSTTADLEEKGSFGRERDERKGIMVSSLLTRPDTVTEKEIRFEIFKKNVEYMEAMNKLNKGFTLGLNEFSDIINEEFHATHNGYKRHARHASSVKPTSFKYENLTDVPVSIDWRSQDAVVGSTELFIGHIAELIKAETRRRHREGNPLLRYSRRMSNT